MEGLGVPLPLALRQLGRIIGIALEERLGLPVGAVPLDALHDEQVREVQRLTDAYAVRIADALIAETMASDDVQDAEAAAFYLEDRLACFGPLLSSETRRRIRARLHTVTHGWPTTG